MQRCEAIKGVPSPYRNGWTLWGDTGYGLESSLRPREVYYELASAGLCKIQGTPEKGVLKDAQPSPLGIAPVTTPVSATSATPDTQPIAQPQEIPFGTILAIGLLIAVGVAYLQDRMKK